MLRANTDQRYTTSGALHVPGGQGPSYWGSGDVYTIKASCETTNGSLGLVEATVPPGGGPIAHVHTRADAAFYVLAGELEILDGGATFMARAGDFVYVPRGIRHRYRNAGLHAARLLFLFSPGGAEQIIRFGKEPRPGQSPPARSLERISTQDLLSSFQDAGIVFLTDDGDGHDPRFSTRGAVHVPAGTGPTTWFSGDVYTIKASGASTDGSLGFVEATVPPGGGPVAHVHTRTDESFYILSGELEILDGGRTFMAGAGDFVFIPHGIRHRFKNTGVHATKMVFTFTPGGEESVFVYGDEARPGQTPPPWPPERFATPEILRFSEEHGVLILPED